MKRVLKKNRRLWTCSAFCLLLVLSWVFWKHSANDRYNIRKVKNIVETSVEAFEITETYPPEKQAFMDILDARPDVWGKAYRLEYYKGRATLRSAGPDKIFYTRDDIYAQYGP